MIDIRLVVLLFVCLPFSALSQETKERYFDQEGIRVLEKSKSFYYQRDQVDSALSIQDTLHIFYTKSDSLFGREIYRNGKLNGPFVYYYPNGRIKERGIYKDSERLGYNFHYYLNGTPKATFFYPEKKGQISNFKDYDFLIINFWDHSGKQLVTNGNGYCNCTIFYKNRDFLDLTNPKNKTFSNDDVLSNMDYYHDANVLKSEVKENGKVRDGLRDSLWHSFNMNGQLLHKEMFNYGNLKSGESYRDGKVFRYYKLFTTPEDNPNGLFYFYKEIGENIKYPVLARNHNIQGEVLVSFIVNSDGKFTDFTIIKGLGSGCDEEAIRAIRTSETKFTPSTKRGQPIKTKLVMPITFKLG